MQHSKIRQLAFLGLASATLLAPGLAGAAGDTDSQSTSVDAVLIQPIDITTGLFPLRFGTLIKNTLSGPVTITLDPQASLPPLVTSSNPAEVFPLPGEGEADANFTVTGEPNRLVQVSVDAAVTIQKGAGGSPQTEMTVDGFNVDVYNNVGDPDIHNDGTDQFTLPADGGANLELGGILHVENDDQFGAYTGSVTVTVSYI